MGIQDREHLEVVSIETLIDWFEANHLDSPGLWVITHKKNSKLTSPSYDELVRTALCFGWVDSISGKVDEFRSKLYFSPRKPTSAWSQSNKLRVDELIQAGLMRPAGIEKVDLAKTNGTWELIDSAQNAEVPVDLASAFEDQPNSRANFEAFPRGVRKQILEWITQAKTPETREKRILETASLAAQGIRANQWRDKKNAEKRQAKNG